MANQVKERPTNENYKHEERNAKGQFESSKNSQNKNNSRQRQQDSSSSQPRNADGEFAKKK